MCARGEDLAYVYCSLLNAVSSFAGVQCCMCIWRCVGLMKVELSTPPSHCHGTDQCKHYCTSFFTCPFSCASSCDATIQVFGRMCVLFALAGLGCIEYSISASAQKMVLSTVEEVLRRLCRNSSHIAHAQGPLYFAYNLCPSNTSAPSSQLMELVGALVFLVVDRQFWTATYLSSL